MLGLIGAGNMARALASGLGEPLLVTDAGSGRAQALADAVGGEAVASNRELAERATLIVLCHKPAQLGAVARECGESAAAVLSLLGRTPLSELRAAFPAARVARAMPNTAVEIRSGMSCLARESDDVGARELLERVGGVVELPEAQIDAATAVIGVAPAYTALIAEAQIDAAIRHGIPPAVAAELVGGALAGSAALLRAREMDTLAVRREVTSPGGLTARGLEALEQSGLRAAFAHAMDAVLESR